MAQKVERISLLLPKHEAEMLREHAKQRGFVIHAGQNIGEGSVSAFLRALVRGEITMFADWPPPGGIGGGDSVNPQEAMERLEWVEREKEQIMVGLAEVKRNQEHLMAELAEAKRNQEQLMARSAELKRNQEQNKAEIAEVKRDQEKLDAKVDALAEGEARSMEEHGGFDTSGALC